MDELKIFVSVVDNGSFTAAAAALDLTVAATSRRVKALERRLGARLLNRTTRRLSLTEAGQTYYHRVRRILAELRETEEQLVRFGAEPQGQMRITAPMSFGVRRLGPLVAGFAARHGGLQVQLQLDDRVVDILEAGLDLALRIGEMTDSSLVARPIAPIRRFVCAGPGYLKAQGTPERPRDLLRHSCLHYSNLSLRDEWTLTGPEGAKAVRVEGRFCSNNGDVLCQAAVQGLGIALLPDFIVEPELAQGRLTRVLERYEPRPFTLYALYPSRRFVPGKVRMFLDYLSSAIGAPQADQK